MTHGVGREKPVERGAGGLSPRPRPPPPQQKTASPTLAQRGKERRLRNVFCCGGGRRGDSSLVGCQHCRQKRIARHAGKGWQHALSTRPGNESRRRASRRESKGALEGNDGRGMTGGERRKLRNNYRCKYWNFRCKYWKYLHCFPCISANMKGKCRYSRCIFTRY